MSCSEGISRKFDDVTCRVYSGSEGSNIETAVIMLQEWWGVTEQLELHAHFLARELKTTVVVPDLYDGKSTLEQEEAQHLMTNLDWPKAVTKLGNLAKAIKAKKTAVLGFCMGGALSVAAATTVGTEAFTCGVVFYGVPPKDLADPANCRIPMQGHFGARDNMDGFSDPATAKVLEQGWKKAGIEYEMFTYPAVGHAFMNNTEQAVAMKKKLGQIGEKEDAPKHDAEAIQTAWNRTKLFLRKHGI